MHTLIKLTALAPLLVAMPAQAQDILAPLKDMVEQLTAPAERPTPKPVGPPKASEVAPVPRPRPPDLPAAPVVSAPVVPAEQLAPVIEPEPEVKPEGPSRSGCIRWLARRCWKGWWRPKWRRR